MALPEIPTFRGDQAMPADHHVVGNLHAGCRSWSPRRSTVSRLLPRSMVELRTDLDIVLNDHAPGLRNLQVASGAGNEDRSRPGRSATPGMNDDRIAEQRVAIVTRRRHRAALAYAHARPITEPAPITVSWPISRPGPMTDERLDGDPSSSRAAGPRRLEATRPPPGRWGAASAPPGTDAGRGRVGAVGIARDQRHGIPRPARCTSPST